MDRWPSNKVSNCFSSPIPNDNDYEIDIIAERTLRELVALDVVIQILCIQYPDLDVQCEIKSNLI